MMSWKPTLILAVLVLLMGGYILFIEPALRPGPVEKLKKCVRFTCFFNRGFIVSSSESLPVNDAADFKMLATWKWENSNNIECN